MSKFFKYLFIFISANIFLNCSSDDDCPDIIEINLNDPESIKRAEACGLSPAGPIGTIWISENYRRNHDLKELKGK